MRTILHIGAEKTGTTALQRTFDRSRSQLAAAGVHYPMADDRSCLLGDRRPEFLADRETWRRQVAERFPEELSSQPSTLLLSSEFFGAQLIDVDEIRRLRTLLDHWSDEYVVVMYMRRQDRARVSLHSTDLRVGSDQSDFFGPPPFSPVGFDYERIPRMWAQVFGDDAVRPRVYETARTGEGGLLGDFLRATELPVRASELAPIPASANPAISAKARQVILEYNRLTGGRPAITREEIAARRLLVGVVTRMFRGPAEVPTRADAEAYLQRYTAGNSWVARTWFGGRQLFDDSFDEYPERPLPPPNVTVSDVMRVSVRLAKRLAEAQLSTRATGRDARRQEDDQ